MILNFYRIKSRIISLLPIAIFLSCNLSVKEDSSRINVKTENPKKSVSNDSGVSQKEEKIIALWKFDSLSAIRLGHTINTAAHEYLPVLDKETKKLYFSGMDRTGFFDFKIDYTTTPSSGGEDIFASEFQSAVWQDARPVTLLNTNGHEAITQVIGKNQFLITANYPEKLGPRHKNKNEGGMETTDIFEVIIEGGKPRIQHFTEPVNSIYTESDAIYNSDKNALLFVSDRPGGVGEYHKKGWAWNNSMWGNTDVYVSIKSEDRWQVPVSLGKLVNSPGAERAPWLSEDELTLYLSSNGYVEGKTDLDIYAFTRNDKNNWTDWKGPFRLASYCSDKDDWGYKTYIGWGAFYSRSKSLGFRPTQGGTAGDGGIRETNFRTGYEVTGAQIASLKGDEETDIYWLKPATVSILTLPDVLFAVNSSDIRDDFFGVLNRFADWCSTNPEKTLRIEGHCDKSGSEKRNEELSLQRAESIKNYLKQKGVKNKIISTGKGSREPLNQNNNAQEKAKNRRIECYLE